MTGPFEVDVEAAKALYAGEHCPMTDHGSDEPRPVEVVVTQKLTTADQATTAALFLGRQVPVRAAVIVRCTDEDCQWGREIVGLEPDFRQTHAGLGYVDVPPPHAGDEP